MRVTLPFGVTAKIVPPFDVESPDATSIRVSFPVPAPSSTTRLASSGTNQRATSTGHSGLARAYSSACAPKVSRRGVSPIRATYYVR